MHEGNLGFVFIMADFGDAGAETHSLKFQTVDGCHSKQIHTPHLESGCSTNTIAVGGCIEGSTSHRCSVVPLGLCRTHLPFLQFEDHTSPMALLAPLELMDARR